MPTPENVQLQVSVNGGPPQTGAIEVEAGDTIAISIAAPAGVKRAVYKIWECPEAFVSVPSGWTAGSIGFLVTTTNGAAAPTFTMPSPWGKYFLSLTVNDQRRDGKVVADLFDDTTYLYVASVSGLRDLGFGESNQADAIREWAGEQKRNLRTLDTALQSIEGASADPLNIYFGPDADPGGTGTRTAPFDTASDAVAALTETGTIWLLPGDYSAVDWAATKDLILRAVVPVSTGAAGLVSFYTPTIQCDDLTVSAGKKASLYSVGVDAVALGAGSAVELYASSQAASVTNAGGTGVVGIVDSQVTGSIAAGTVWGRSAQWLGDTMTVSGEAVDFQDSYFGGTPVITFSGSSGTLQVDDYSNYWWDAAGGSITNGLREIVSLGAGGGASLPFAADHGDTIATGEIDAGGSDAKLITWGVDDVDILSLGDNTLVAGQQYRIASGGNFGFYVDDVNVANVNAAQLELEGIDLRLTSGHVEHGTQVATTGDYRVGSGWSLIGLNETLSADRDILTYNTGTVTLGGSTADTSVVRGTTSAIVNVNGTTMLSFDTTSGDFGATVIKQGSSPASAGDFRTKSVWRLAANLEAGGGDVDLLQKTSANLVIIGDSTDASGVEFKTKTGTTFIFDIAGTDEYTMSATALDLGSNNLTATGNIILGSGATSAASGRIRFSDNDTLTVYDGSTRVLMAIASSVLTIGSASTFTRYNSFDVHQFSINNTPRFQIDATTMRHDASAAATWSLLSTATTGTGFLLTIKGEDKTGSGAGTHTAGAVTFRAGDATGAGQTHVGGALTIQAGDATGGSGTRTGGALVIRAGTGATANGELSLQDGSTKRIRIDGTGMAFFNTAPIAKPTVSGAKGSNAALGSLMTALSNLGLVTDSTSA